LPELCAQADTALTRLGGQTLAHTELRADNLLIDSSGEVIDWPWACRGPAWLDTLMLLTEVHQYGGHDVDALPDRGPTADIDPQTVTAFLTGYAGYFLDAARWPAPLARTAGHDLVTRLPAGQRRRPADLGPGPPQHLIFGHWSPRRDAVALGHPWALAGALGTAPAGWSRGVVWENRGCRGIRWSWGSRCRTCRQP
jgi:hypothetical protein